MNLQKRTDRNMSVDIYKNEIIIKRADTAGGIYKSVEEIITQYDNHLPVNKDAAIVLKPNLNSNMNALTGNTTDLRIIVAVVKILHSKGYKNITIAEGTNSGFHRQGIDVIKRLKVDVLSDKLGIKYLDTNSVDARDVVFEDGVVAMAAKIFFEADYFINLPKLKMHYETEMSACLKSLIGCLAGMKNKQKTHYSLIKNICNLNDQIKPNLHILDAVIAMEGTGPTTGTPIKGGLIVAGSNPYLIDAAAAIIAHVPINDVPVLKEAKERGKLNGKDLEYLETLGLGSFSTAFKRPQISWLTALVTHKKLQKYFQKIRHAPGIGSLFDKGLGNKLLFRLGVTQEVMINNEMGSVLLNHNHSRCIKCGYCKEYCPMGKPEPDKFSENCIGCLYCFSCCPQRAISVNGELGFFEEQIKQYDDIIRVVVQKKIIQVNDIL